MREITVAGADGGKRLDKWLMGALPALSMGQAQKFIRLKRVKLNGKPARMDARVAPGDILSLYIGDEYFDSPAAPRADKLLSRFTPHINAVYEDEQLLIVDKRPGLICHPDENEKVNTLLTHARAYLYQKGAYDSMDPAAFAPVLVNRIDRFTGGIVLIAKTEEAMRVLSQKIRDHEIEKRYLLAAFGRMRSDEGRLEGDIVKPAGAKRVAVADQAAPGGKLAVTIYKTLAFARGISLIECLLITGRTHQIRAQFAHAGCPLVGDDQYGDRAANAALGARYQALYAYSVAFRFRGDAGVLNDVNGRRFCVKQVPFARQWFPDFDVTRLLSE